MNEDLRKKHRHLQASAASPGCGQEARGSPNMAAQGKVEMTDTPWEKDGQPSQIATGAQSFHTPGSSRYVKFLPFGRFFLVNFGTHFYTQKETWGKDPFFD